MKQEIKKGKKTVDPTKYAILGTILSVTTGLGFYDYSEMPERFANEQSHIRKSKAYEKECAADQINKNIIPSLNQVFKNTDTTNIESNFQNALNAVDLNVTIEDITLCADKKRQEAQKSYENERYKNFNTLSAFFATTVLSLGTAGTATYVRRREKKKEAANNNPTPS